MADRRLQVFKAVAQRQSFTRAAEMLMMTQPAVTFQIRQLEEHLNARLFERGYGQITLTSAGQLVLEYADRILALNDEMESRLAEMTGQMRGPLVIGASTTIAEFLLPSILGEFNALYPDVRTRLVVANSGSVLAQLSEHSIDVGLIESGAMVPNFECLNCGEDELLAICAPDHPLAALSAATPAELAEYEFISREPGSGTRAVTDAYFQAAGVAPESLKTLMELGSPEALKGVVGTGLGFAIVSRTTVSKEIELGRLLAVPLAPRLRRQLVLIHPRERFSTRVMRNFVAFAHQQLAAMLSS